MQELEKKLNIEFKNKELLKTAFTHTSYAYEHNVESNEKLEFLGDSILEFITSNYLYQNYKNLKEGEMTKIRAQVVCEDSLVCIAQKYNFSDFLLLGKSEKAFNESKGHSILADAVEALIATIYLDSGLETVENFILTNLKDEIEKASKNVGMKDYKTVLQEKLQVHGDVLIKYNVIREEGPDHNKVFTTEVTLNGKRIGVGVGTTKKSAEMQAAKEALENMEK